MKKKRSNSINSSLLASSLLVLCLLATNVLAYDPPYNNPIFQDVLGKAKLQFPTDKIRIGYGRFNGRAKPYFYLEKGRYMTFKIKKEQHSGMVRAELRLGPTDWQVNTLTPKILNAELHLSNPENLQQITILQIHAVTPSYPPLRITWLRSHRGINNHVWAIFRPSPYRRDIRYVDLGQRQGKIFSHYRIQVMKNTLQVWAEGELKMTQSLTNWQGTYNYFKAGIYLSGKADEGLAKVRFRLLEYH